MYLLMRKIHSMGIKMVLSGEGADEIFGGYLYFHKARTAASCMTDRAQAEQAAPLRLPARQQEQRRLERGGRVPFLDREFLDVAMMMDPEVKLPRNAKHPRPSRSSPARQLPRLHPRRDPVAAEGAVLRRRGLRLDQRPARHRRKGDQRRHDARRGRAVPGEDPGDQGSLHVPPAVRDPLPPGHRHQLRALGRSVACSTETALKWDAAFQNNADPSGRAVAGVHDLAY